MISRFVACPLLPHSFQLDRTTEADLLAIKGVVEQFPGSQRLELEFVGGGGSRVRMKAVQGVRFSSELREKLAPWLAKS